MRGRVKKGQRIAGITLAVLKLGAGIRDEVTLETTRERAESLYRRRQARTGVADRPPR